MSYHGVEKQQLLSLTLHESPVKQKKGGIATAPKIKS